MTFRLKIPSKFNNEYLFPVLSITGPMGPMGHTGPRGPTGPTTITEFLQGTLVITPGTQTGTLVFNPETMPSNTGTTSTGTITINPGTQTGTLVVNPEIIQSNTGTVQIVSGRIVETGQTTLATNTMILGLYNITPIGFSNCCLINSNRFIKCPSSGYSYGLIISVGGGYGGGGGGTIGSTNVIITQAVSFSGIGDFFRDVGNHIGDQGRNIINDAKNLYDTLYNDISAIGDTVFNNYIATIGQIRTTIANDLPSIVNNYYNESVNIINKIPLDNILNISLALSVATGSYFLMNNKYLMLLIAV